MKSRASSTKRLNWLLDNPTVWEGEKFPHESSEAGAVAHRKRVFEAIQKAGLFSRNTQLDPVSMMKLVDRARAIRRKTKQPAIN